MTRTHKSEHFPRSCRLSGRAAFEKVFQQRRRRSRGPLTVYSRPNAMGYSRLGLSVSRRAGSAARRNRFKRLIREAFRLGREQLPHGYDWVVVIRGHEPLRLADYQHMMRELTQVDDNPRSGR